MAKQARRSAIIRISSRGLSSEVDDVYNMYKRLAGDRSDVPHVYTTKFPASIMTLGVNGSVLKSSVKRKWAAVNAVNAAHIINVCKAFKKHQEKMVGANKGQIE